MQNSPDKVALLAAVAKFLDGDVREAIDDPALAFRVRIAANIAKIVATECHLEDRHDGTEFEGLVALMPDVNPSDPPASSHGRRKLIAKLNAELAERIRSGALTDTKAAGAHLRRALGDRIAVINDRFDLSMEIE